MTPRTLCLDVGTRRLGVAVSDPLGMTAQPLDVIDMRNIKAARAQLCVLVEHYAPATIVVGLPLTMMGQEGAAVRRVRLLVQQLASAWGDDVDVVEFDERWSTAAAERALLEGDVSRRRRRDVIDSVAASLILQGYLGS